MTFVVVDSRSASGTKLSARSPGSDSAEMCTHFLSAPIGRQKPGPAQKCTLFLSAKLDAIEADRRRLGFTKAALSRAAGLNGQFYSAALRNPRTVRPTSIAALRAGLRELAAAKASGAADGSDLLVQTTYQGFLVSLAAAKGADIGAVRAQLARAGQCTADPAWKAASHLRQAAIFLVNTGLGVPQHRIARALGLTAAAVCLAVRDVMDRCDDPAFARLLAATESLVTGRVE